MKRIIKISSVWLAVCMLIALLPAGVYASSDAWDGTSIDVTWYNTTDTKFTITTPAQLAGLAAIVNGTAVDSSGASIQWDSFSGKTINIGSDIDLGNKNWTPIGSATSKPFRGVFNGAEHTISGLYISATDSCGGLFGYVMVPKASSGEQKYAYINDVIVKGNVSINLTSSAAKPVAGLCAKASYVEITNCSVDISVSATTTKANPQCGGIVGTASNYLRLTNCINIGNISGCKYVGGLVGETPASSAKCWLIVSNCVNKGNISGNSYIGGLVGQFETSYSTSTSEQSALINCYNTGCITATDGYAGGLSGVLGYNSKASCGNIVENCFTTGSVIVAESAVSAGAVFGENKNPGGNPAGDLVSCVYYASDIGISAIGSGEDLIIISMSLNEFSSPSFVSMLNTNAYSLGATEDVFKAGLDHPIFVWQPDEMQDALLGDIDGNGSINAEDVSDLIYAISKGNTLDPAIADINLDGSINATDASELIDFIQNR